MTDFSCGFNTTIPNSRVNAIVEAINTTTANNNISSFYITYDKQYPNPAYTFGNDVKNAMELSRAYYETLINTTVANNNISSFYITYDKQYPNPAYTFGNDPTNAI